MDLLQLRYFQAVARHEHVTRAAEELRVGQPSLSRTIGRLERELGVKLFDRDGRRLRLNRYGEVFLRRVDRALQELDDARREVVDAAGLEQGIVAIASETLRTVSPLLSGFLSERPEVRVRLFQSAAERMLEQLETGEVDLCFASQPLPGSLLASVELAREPVLLAVPPGHRLAGRKRVRIGELSGEPFVTTRRGYWLRVLAERLFGEAGIEPSFSCEGDEPAAIRGLIGDGLGIGLLPAIARHAAHEPAVAWVAVDAPRCSRTLTLVWRRDAYLSLAARRFREATIEHYDDAAAGGR
jgi:DNA-binding transcriptional LysR family regulator